MDLKNFFQFPQNKLTKGAQDVELLLEFRKNEEKKKALSNFVRVQHRTSIATEKENQRED